MSRALTLVQSLTSSRHELPSWLERLGCDVAAARAAVDAAYDTLGEIEEKLDAAEQRVHTAVFEWNTERMPASADDSLDVPEWTDAT